VSVDRVDVPQIMEMQAVLTDRAYGMRQDACRLISRSAAARLGAWCLPWLSTGN
jgi:hypothetical protein